MKFSLPKSVCNLIGATAMIIAGSVHIATADQLDKITEAGVLRVGTDTGFPPYGFLNERLEPTGSDIEIARLLAEDWGLELEFVDTVSGTRVSNLTSDRADIIISSLSKNPERAEVIDFSTPYSVIQAVVGGIKSADVSEIGDLSGMKVAVTRGAVPDFVMSAIAEENGFTIQRFDDDAALVTAGVTGQAELVASSGNILHAISERNSDFEDKFVQRTYLLHFGLKKNEPALMEKVNAWIVANLENGKLNEIHKEFHFKDLPSEVTEAAQ